MKTLSDVARDAFAHSLARCAGDVILPHFRSALTAEDKSGGGAFDPVTIADREAEAAMRAMIAQAWPDHGVIGEEAGEHRSDAEHVWVLDPIDGTKSFISGFPTWGVLIGLLHRSRPVFGLMHQPFTGESFSGDGARACATDRSGERPLRTRACGTLAEATLMTTHPDLLGAEGRTRFRRVEAQVRLSRYGGDCYAYAMLAAGHIDLVIEEGLKPHDIVALIPIIEGAGGVVTTWAGGPAQQGGAIIAAGDARLHAQAMALLAGG